MDSTKPVLGSFIDFMRYLPLRKFAQFNTVGLVNEDVVFPVSELPMQLLGQNKRVQVMKYGQQQIVVEAGSELLYNTARRKYSNHTEHVIAGNGDTANGFFIIGYYNKLRPFLVIGLKDDDGAAAVLRIETPDIPVNERAAMLEQTAVACSFNLRGFGLECP